MELTLQRIDDAQGEVLCNGQTSHTFLLAPLQQAKRFSPPTVPRAYGKALYQALFPPNSPALHALNAGPERLLLVCTDESLDAIAWEYLYGPHGYLVLDLPFVRGLPLEKRIEPPAMQDAPLHIVAVPSNPLDPDRPALNIDAEWQRLAQIVRELPHACTLERTRPPTVEQVRALVANKKQRVIHFMGHGEQDPSGAQLCFEQENGAPDLIDAHHFVQRVRSSVFLVTLNACVSATPGPTAFNNLAAALVQHRVPYALGMRFNIADDDALAFTRSFYSELAQGTSVEEALQQARLTLSKSPFASAIGIPVLYTALSAPAAGFGVLEGIPSIKEHQPLCNVNALPRASGTFQGRQDDLKAIGDYLTGNTRPRVLTIHGPGGQGKTTLAREVAERYAFAWPGGVYAHALENLPTRSTFAIDLARLLGINTQTIVDPNEIERLIQTQLSRKRTLLIIDNAETLIDAIEAKNAAAIDLAQYLRQLPGPNVSLLVTSRAHLQWPGETLYELDGLTPGQGADLFAECAPSRPRKIDSPLAEQLSRKLEGHPFSLRVLGYAFNSSDISLQTFVNDCEKRLSEAEDKYVALDHRHRTLYACLDTSTRYLSPDLRALLSGLWIFHAPFLPEAAVVIFDPESEDTEEHPSPIRDWLHTLWQRGLLSYEAYDDLGVKFYHLLPVMRNYIKERLEQTIEETELLTRFGGAYARLASYLYERLDMEAAASLIALQANDDLERGLHYVHGLELGWYLHSWGWVIYRLGYPTRAETLQQAALAISREVGDRAGEAATLSNLAGLYRGTGRVQEAERLYGEALAIRREVGDRAGEATTLNNLAGLYQGTGRVQEAERLYGEALPIRREVGNRAGEAATLGNLAWLLYEHFRKDQEAIALMAQAVGILLDTGLPQDAAGQTVEELQAPLQRMHAGLPLARGDTLSAEAVQEIIDVTVAVMTVARDKQAEWREYVTGELEDARQQGADWQIEVEFYTALLALLDGQLPALPADHPYARVIERIRAGIAAYGGEK